MAPRLTRVEQPQHLYVNRVPVPTAMTLVASEVRASGARANRPGDRNGVLRCDHACTMAESTISAASDGHQVGTPRQGTHQRLRSHAADTLR